MATTLMVRILCIHEEGIHARDPFVFMPARFGAVQLRRRWGRRRKFYAAARAQPLGGGPLSHQDGSLLGSLRDLDTPGDRRQHDLAAVHRAYVYPERDPVRRRPVGKRRAME